MRKQCVGVDIANDIRAALARKGADDKLCCTFGLPEKDLKKKALNTDIWKPTSIAMTRLLQTVTGTVN